MKLGLELVIPNLKKGGDEKNSGVIVLQDLKMLDQDQFLKAVIGVYCFTCLNKVCEDYNYVKLIWVSKVQEDQIFP